MTKKILLGFIFCFLAINTQAQNKKVLDSLNSVYQNAKHDTTKILALTSIAYEYRRSKPDTCLLIAEKGNGLGLHLVKDLVEKNGGKIWVESIENEGSTFIFSLPISQN